MRRSNFARKPRGNVKTKYFPLSGGLNQVDAPLDKPPGMALFAVNYELLTRDGYRRVDGIERYDGQPLASEASYWVLNYDAGTTAILEGDIVTGAISGVTGEVLLDQVGSVASGYIVLTNVTGVYQNNEGLEVSAAKVAVADGVSVIRNAPTPALDAIHAQDAIETQRAKILQVGSANGSGPVRGVNVFNGDIYAFRDNTGATECLMWKSTAAGWVQQSLGNRVAFTTGTAAFVEGETLTQTGTTATINRVVLQSGDWSTSDAAGYLIIGTVTSGPYAAGVATSASGSATLSGVEVANTIVAGGRFEFRNDNFFATTFTKRMYGVSGVDYAFEWDGSVFVPIITGNVVDTPTHLEVNELHLALVFANGSLQNSATGLPYQWAGGGAAEIGVGDDIIGLQKEVGGPMVVLCRNRIRALYGKNTADSPWDLKPISSEAGGIEWTMARLGETRYLDDRGFMSLNAVQEFGDFTTASYSQLIEPTFKTLKATVLSTVINKTKSQIRTFFEDGVAIIATFNDKQLSGFTTASYVDLNGNLMEAFCTANGEDASGYEISFIGSSTGYVYKLDSGTSFDGGPVKSLLKLSYDHQGSPAYNKQYKKVTIEADGSDGAILKYNITLDYNSGKAPSGITKETTLSSGSTVWNNISWNLFNWTSSDITQIEGDVTGVGRNISIEIASEDTYVDPHTLYGVTYHYILRKLVR